MNRAYSTAAKPSFDGDSVGVETSNSGSSSSSHRPSIAARSSLDYDTQYRTIFLNNSVSPAGSADANANSGSSHDFASNKITNTKYTWYSLVPKSLWNQFRRLANVYFLVMSIIMMVGNETDAYDAPIIGMLLFGSSSSSNSCCCCCCCCFCCCSNSCSRRSSGRFSNHELLSRPLFYLFIFLAIRVEHSQTPFLCLLPPPSSCTVPPQAFTPY